MPENATGWAGWVVSAVLAIITIATQLRKARTDESAIALQMWEGLARAHSTEIQALTDRLTLAEKQIAEMRLQHAKAEADRERQHQEEMKALRTENESLMRMIIQNSQSTAQMMGDPGGTALTQASRNERRDK